MYHTIYVRQVGGNYNMFVLDVNCCQVSASSDTLDYHNALWDQKGVAVSSQMDILFCFLLIVYLLCIYC